MHAPVSYSTSRRACVLGVGGASCVRHDIVRVKRKRETVGARGAGEGLALETAAAAVRGRACG